ncbi:STAS domain-containing protein [Aeromicrobium tamlense]|uniref:Anti-anti-sigma factor n=1 Tax=Aeromicrobium tamlense TaxID=375541 RepID=A0A8I0G074_9ACTN|nr:STAS domain-containing protein [Aeromicrobium tamlense]MBD1271758.1 STAS domain-containing protein [Aeromicrobium tamlense]NYI37494.1 anti-anti-sigma factor [Aeromicrobium tamlense]
MQTDFQFSCDPPLAQVRIFGELDPSTTAHLADVLECLATRGCTRVEVDVEEVTYVDESNLRVLRDEQLRLRARGGDLEVVGDSDYHRVVARRAGCADLFPSSLAEDAEPWEGVGS